MKRFLIFFASVTFFPVFHYAQSNEDQAIRKVLNDMTAALKTRDVATLNSIWADDYVFVTPAGLVHNKAQRADIIKSGPAIEFFSYDQPKIRLYGNNNLAVINTMVRVKNAGQDSTANPTTLVMFKNAGRWKVVNGQGTPTAVNAPGGNDEQTLKSIEQEMLDALLKGDATANERYLSDTYVFTAPDGTVMDKTRAVADIKSHDLKFESSKLDDMKVMVHGNSAVVTYRSTDKGKYKDVDLSGQYRWTDTFTKQNGRWQIIAGHGTKLMAQ